jgi:hypothetical protein
MYSSSEFKTSLNDKPHNVSTEVFGEMFFYRQILGFLLKGCSMDNLNVAVFEDLSIPQFEFRGLCKSGQSFYVIFYMYFHS